MNEVERIEWKAPKANTTQGPWSLEANDFVPSKDFFTSESMLVQFGPRDTAANHRHQQVEILVGLIGELYLIWRDAKGQRHEEKLLSSDGLTQAFVIAPHVPHLIENRSTSTSGIMQVWNGVRDENIVLSGKDSLRQPA